MSTSIPPARPLRRPSAGAGGEKGGEIGSLLLGLYDDGGLLQHVGFTASFTREERRFRHGTKFLRWRPDKAPGSCTFAQVGRP